MVVYLGASLAMSNESSDHAGRGAPSRIVVTSPSGLPVTAWSWRGRDGEPSHGVAVARMTLRASGDDWVRADMHEPLPPDSAELARTAVALGTVQDRLILGDADEGSLPGPIRHDAQVIIGAAGSSQATRLRGGLPTLLGTSTSGTQRIPFEIIALRWSLRRRQLVLDLCASLQWSGPAAPRLLLVIDDDTQLDGDEESTLTTPGRHAGQSAALPFQGSSGNAGSSGAAPHSEGASAQRRAATGLPFQEDDGAPIPVGSAPVATAYPGQTRTMFMAAHGPGARAAVPASPEPRQPAPLQPPQRIAAPVAFVAAALPPMPPTPVAIATPAPVAPPFRISAPPLRPFGAADASDRASTPKDGSGSTTAAASRAASQRPAAIDLLWFDPDAGERFRSVVAWRRLLREAESDPARAALADAESTANAEARRAAVEIMLAASPDSLASFRDKLTSALAPRGAFRAPLAMATARLVVAFDERATLAAYCAASRAQALADATFSETWKPCSELVAEDDPLIPIEDLLAAAASLRTAFAARPRPLSGMELDGRVEQALVARRRYKTVELMGTPWMRAALVAGDPAEGGDRIITYLPAPCAQQWPLASALAVRAIVELTPPQELVLDEPVAARILALARCAPAPTEKDV